MKYTHFMYFIHIFQYIYRVNQSQAHVMIAIVIFISLLAAQ